MIRDYGDKKLRYGDGCGSGLRQVPERVAGATVELQPSSAVVDKDS